MKNESCNNQSNCSIGSNNTIINDDEFLETVIHPTASDDDDTMSSNRNEMITTTTTTTPTNTNTTVINYNSHNFLPSSLASSSSLIHEGVDMELIVQAIETGNRIDIQECMNTMDQFDINVHVYKDKTMLYYACMYGKIDIVQYIVQDLHADITIKNKIDGKNALHVACDYGHLQVVLYLLDRDNQIVHCKQNDGCTALHIACYKGYINIMKHLLTIDNIDITETQNDGWTILHIATRHGHYDIVQYILNVTKVSNNNDVTFNLQLLGMLANDGKLALHFACRDGYYDIVQCLLHDDYSMVNIQDQNGWCALHYAARYNYLKIVRYLIDVCHAQMDQCTRDGKTALHLACIYGHSDTVKYMLLLMQGKARNITPTFPRININCGSPTPYKDDLGNVWEADDTNKYYVGGSVVDNANKLHSLRDIDHARYRYQRYGTKFLYSIPNLPNGYYKIDIHSILWNNSNTQNHLIFINDKVHTNIKDKVNAPPTPFCFGATNNTLHTNMGVNATTETFETYVASKKLCIRFEGNSNTTNVFISCIAVVPIQLETATTTLKEEIQAFHYACMYGWLDIVQFFVQKKIISLELERCHKPNALRIAIRHNQIEIIKYLLPHYDNAIDSTMTHLQYASMYGSLISVEYLLSIKEINVNEVNGDNWTALHFASRNGHVDVVKCLMTVANIEMKTSSGCTALMLAARYGHLDVVQYLIRYTYANVDAESNDGLTALHFATLHGYYDVVQYLLKDGNANAGAKTKQGLTALHIAGTQNGSNSLKIAKLLLLEYPSSNTNNNKGESPLDYAIRIMQLNGFSVYLNELDTNDIISLLRHHTLGSSSKVIDTFYNDAHNNLYDTW